MEHGGHGEHGAQRCGSAARRALRVLRVSLLLAGAAQGQPAVGPAAVAIDFSHAGYGGGGVRIPDVPAAVTVRPGGGDDGARIQAALDRVEDAWVRDVTARGSAA